jgi:hypothetical protein
MVMVKKAIYLFYYSLKKNKYLFRIVAWLQSHYVTVLAGDLVNYPQNIRNRFNPQKYKEKSWNYYNKNKCRVENVINMLEDEESRKAYKAAVGFRPEADDLEEESGLCVISILLIMLYNYLMTRFLLIVVPMMGTL